MDFWFYSYRGGQGAKCVEALCVEGREGGKMCRSTMRRNLHKLTKVFNDVLSKYLKNSFGDLHKTL